MAGIDYTIPQQFKGAQIESPMNALTRALQLRELQESSEMRGLKLQKAIADAKSAEIMQRKHETDLFDSKFKQSRLFLESIDPNSPTAAQDYLAWHTANHKDPVLGPVLASRGANEATARARINEAIRTGRLGELITQSKLGMDKFYELTPAFNKAEKEQIDQEFSDYLNDPGNPPLTRLQFVEWRKKQRPAGAPLAAPVAAPVAETASAEAEAAKETAGPPEAAPAPTPTPAPAATSTSAQDYEPIVFGEPHLEHNKRAILNNRRRLYSQDAYEAEQERLAAQRQQTVATDGRLPTIMQRPGQGNAPPAFQVNNLIPASVFNASVNALVPAPAQAAPAQAAPAQAAPAQAAPAQAAPAQAAPAQADGGRPAIHPEAARLMRSNLQSDRDRAAIIQRNYENELKQTDKQRDYAAAVQAGFKGKFPEWLDQQRETESEREYRKAKEEGSFKGTFPEWKRYMAQATRITLTVPTAKPTDTALDMLAHQYLLDNKTISAVPKQLRMAVVNRATEIMQAQGTSAKDMASQVVTTAQDTAAQKAAVKEFSTGKAANTIRALNTAVDHLTTLDKTIIALENNDIRALNAMGNAINTQMGYAAPTDFDSVKTIVGSEVAKAVAGATMALKDREEIRDALSRANSPAQLRGAVKRFKELMAGQLNSLKIQYESSTGRTDFAVKLSPEARRELGLPTSKPVGAIDKNNKWLK